MPAKKAATTAKKSASAKITTAKTTAKATPAKKVAKGDSYVCGVCGLAVVVDEECGCEDVCDIVCCGQPMKAHKVAVKAKATK
jgi:hypothetical protein